MEQKLELLLKVLNETQKGILLNALIEMQEQSTDNGTYDHIGCWLSIIDE